jgi:hypothetical protein
MRSACARGFILMMTLLSSRKKKAVAEALDPKEKSLTPPD